MDHMGNLAALGFTCFDYLLVSFKVDKIKKMSEKGGLFLKSVVDAYQRVDGVKAKPVILLHDFDPEVDNYDGCK